MARISADAQTGSMLKTIAAVVGWYICGALCGTTTKQSALALEKAYPDLCSSRCTSAITLIQFLVTIVFASVVLFVFKLSPYCHLSSLSSRQRAIMLKLGVLYTLGFATLNVSYGGTVNVSFTETVRAGEPLFIVLLVRIALPEEPLSVGVYLSLIPIITGVALSSLDEPSFDAQGFAMALAANVCFASRNLFTKQLQLGSASVNQPSLFLNQHLIGLLIVGPLALARGELVLLARLVVDTQQRALLPLILFNGFAYFMYNQLSLVVLSQTTAVTHGLGNAMRRIANIVFALIIFGNKPKLLNSIGMLLAIGGAIFYTKVKSAAVSPAVAVSKNLV